LVKTVYRKFGLTSCMALVLAFGLQSVSMSAPAYAQMDLSSLLGGNGGSGTSGLLDPSTFAQNPTSLLTSGNVGNNTLNLLMGGSNGQNAVPPDALAQALSNSGGMQTSVPQATNILQQIQSMVGSGQMSPQAGSNLITGMASNSMQPNLLSALSGMNGLGNMSGNSQSINNLFNNSSIQQLLQGQNSAQGQASMIDQILNSALSGGSSGMNSGGTQALTNMIQNSLPQLASALGGGSAGGSSGAGGLADIISGALGNGGGLSSLLGGGSAGTGGTGSTGSTSTTGSSDNSGGGPSGDKDNGDYRVKSLPVEKDGTNYCGGCGQVGDIIAQDYKQVRQTIKDEFIKHRNWIVNDFWKDNVLPAMMLMAEQLSVIGIQQVEMIGAMLDAKQQLETERLFQQMTAQAHKDYHPSEGMCTFGTTVRSLAASERKSDLTQVGLAGRMMQRQTMDGDVLSFEGPDGDIKARLNKFATTYCEKADNGNGLDKMCKGSGKPERKNIDIDYTRNIESRLTLDFDMTKDGAATGGDEDTADKEDLFALSANLYGSTLPKPIPPEKLAGADNRVRLDGAQKYLDMRAVFAKRSVAQNSFAAITAMRAAGDNGSAPYTKALIKELGINDQDEIEKILGKNPSYFAQMEVLTKKIYQNPTFYTELYDKPVNVERKGAAIQAISLMQDRDLYNSLLRSEAVLSVLLETMLDKEQDKVLNSMGKLDPNKEAAGSGGSP